MAYTPHKCSYPGCNEKTRYDLVLSKRVEFKTKYGLTRSRETLEHIYLCPLHSIDIQEFMKSYSKEV